MHNVTEPVPLSDRTTQRCKTTRNVTTRWYLVSSKCIKCVWGQHPLRWAYSAFLNPLARLIKGWPWQWSWTLCKSQTRLDHGFYTNGTTPTILQLLQRRRTGILQNYGNVSHRGQKDTSDFISLTVAGWCIPRSTQPSIPSRVSKSSTDFLIKIYTHLVQLQLQFM